jgi:integrase
MQPDDLVFGTTKGLPFAHTGMLELAQEIQPGITVHGFRSCFRDWVGDCTGFPREVAEAALAHAVGDRSEQAYRRKSALEKRRKLMQAWSDYVGKVSNVVRLKKA